MAFVDPWDWDVNAVIDAFCKHPEVWIEGRPNTKLPEPRELEQKLRDNYIDGATLLTDFNNEVLKDDLSIKPIGHRSGILFIIAKLREHSLKYKAHALATSHGSLHIPSYVGSFSPAQSLPQQGDYQSSAACLHPVTAGDQLLAYSESVPETVQKQPDTTSPTFETEIEFSSGPRIRPGEALVEDGSRRKRRKLALTADVQPVTSEQPNGYLPTEAVFPGNSVTNILDSAHHDTGYLGPKSLSVDEVFFGQTALGQRINNCAHYETPAGAEWDVRSFVFCLQGAISEGRRHYVSSRLHHFFYRRQTSQTVRGGRLDTVIEPYPDQILTEGQPHSVIVLRQINGEIEARREDKLKLGTDVTYQEDDIHDWDFLQKWNNMKEDEVLPAYGDSDAEDDWSEGLQQEVEAEAAEKAEQTRKKGQLLMKEQVDQIIDEEITNLTQRWQERKLPLRESKAWSVWKRGKDRRKRTMLINEARQAVERMDARLSKIRVELANELWSREKDLRKQCSMMELTVFEREDQGWKISLWQRPQAPLRMAPKARTKREAPSAHASDEDGEVLSSDSDDLRSDINDFIDVDEVMLSPPAQQTAVSDEDKILRLALHDGMSTVPADADDEARDSTPTLPVMDIDRSDEAGEDEGEDTPTDPQSPQHVGDDVFEASPTPRHEATEVIDLTLLSDVATADDDSFQITGSNKIKGAGTSASGFGDRPEEATQSEIEGWEWGMLMERKDRKRIVSKLYFEMETELRSAVTQRVSELSFTYFADEVQRAMGAMQKTSDRIVGLDNEKSKHVIAITRLFICWYECDHRWWTDKLPTDLLKSALSSNLKAKGTDLEVFHAYLRLLAKQRVFKKSRTFGSLPTTPSKVMKFEYDLSFPFSPDSSETIRNPVIYSVPSSPPNFSADENYLSIQRSPSMDSDVDNPLMPSDTPNKKRKRAVMQSSFATDLRAKAHERQREGEARERRLKEELQSTGGALADDAANIVINTGKLEEHDFIYLNTHIASRIKQHQIEGIRFMWREIVTAEQSEMQGCLLAHTMGLGKTMQAVALLVTIAEAAKSPNPKVSEQVPPSLRFPRYLVLCPPSLIENWRDELYMWTPSPREDNVGDIRVVDSHMHINNRLQEITTWYKRGGVLVLGYPMFRIFILNKPVGKGAARLNEEQHMKVQEQLLDGPNIIIADEAHMLRNLTSSVSGAASKFKSRSRVALTGSPLANNLQEYYAMIDWVAPGYLGSLIQFKAKYQEPIEEGSYEDSTRYQQRKSLKMLQVLKNDIEPKINRADITVLKGNLKPKIEFVIKVPLTDIQDEAYKLYVRALLSGSNSEVSNTKLWHWLAILQMLCNHPACFLKKLTERAREQAARKPGTQIEDVSRTGSPGPQEMAEVPTVLPEDVDVSQSGIPESMVKDQQALFAGLQNDIAATNQSFKMQLIFKVLRYSRLAGDKVLIFSHSIPTLDYIEEVLQKHHRKYARLDGTTKMGERQNMSKAFNKGRYDVLLISTRAGGLGFNLPGANRVIITDFNFNPTWEEQAIGRAYRIGQDKPVYVYRFLVGGTVEEPIRMKAVFKTQLAFRVVDKKNPTRAASRTSDFLFEPKEVPQEDIEAYRGMDPLVLDRILGSPVGNHIRSISTTETLHAEADGEKLDPEEQKEVADLIELDKLRRKDPSAYAEKVRFQQQALINQQQALIRESATKFNPPFSTAPSTITVPPADKARPGWTVYTPPAGTAPVQNWNAKLMPMPSALPPGTAAAPMAMPNAFPPGIPTASVAMPIALSPGIPTASSAMALPPGTPTAPRATREILPPGEGPQM